MPIIKKKYSFATIGALSGLLFLSACSGLDVKPVEEEEGPKSILTGKSGGTKLSDLVGGDNSGGALPVNALLWRAALDITSFVPLDDVDTFGGTIVTEWYSLPGKPDERIKITVFVVGKELRSDAIKARIYVQQKTSSGWGSVARDSDLERKIEDLILTRAREIRAASVGESAN